MRRHLMVTGIVQGVGFRPAMYRHATNLGLAGNVFNTVSGVEIEVEGDEKSLNEFESLIKSSPPPLALISEIESSTIPETGGSEFVIRESDNAADGVTLVSPDVATCDDCLSEMNDPDDRRREYPFINCTNCGPRYTIIDGLPYDRVNTSMAMFEMCDRCRSEYTGPSDRRFHAEPVACAECGPQVKLVDGQGVEVPVKYPIIDAADLLKGGRIVAVKGLGGYHLAVDATNNEAVSRLRERKRREEKPFAVMAPDMAAVSRFAHCDSREEKLLNSTQRPIVLLRKKGNAALAPQVAPRNGHFGVMLPYTPVHHLLFSRELPPLVMTSANLSEEPIAADEEEALEKLAGVADYFLVNDRPIVVRCDDSVVRIAGKRPMFVRRARGYAPGPIFLPKKLPQTFAAGADLKNTFCFARGSTALVSQYIGDLEDAATHSHFGRTLEPATLGKRHGEEAVVSGRL
ncbi:carbamoyltransferase HypF [Candidatus Hydrogenedentota bacterium]